MEILSCFHSNVSGDNNKPDLQQIFFEESRQRQLNCIRLRGLKGAKQRNSFKTKKNLLQLYQKNQ